jgi:hypothetical protein
MKQCPIFVLEHLTAHTVQTKAVNKVNEAELQQHQDCIQVENMVKVKAKSKVVLLLFLTSPTP